MGFALDQTVLTMDYSVVRSFSFANTSVEMLLPDPLQESKNSLAYTLVLTWSSSLASPLTAGRLLANGTMTITTTRI